MGFKTTAEDIDSADAIFVIGAAIFTTLLSEGMPYNVSNL